MVGRDDNRAARVTAVKEMKALIHGGYRYAYSLCANRQDAEDLVQEAWTKLTANGGVQSKAQLFTTIKHAYIDQFRRSRVVRFVPLTTATPEIDATHLAADQSSNANAPSTADIEQALSKLRVEEREAIFLSMVEGYTAKEIGDIIDKPRNTVLSLIHRGRRRLSELLVEASPGEGTRRVR